MKIKTYILRITYISDIEITMLTKVIASEKNVKISKLKFKEDKLRGLYSDLLLRYILMKELNINDKKIIFETNEYGKPLLKGICNINFNVSHSGEYVVACIDNKPIGVDIELIRNINFMSIVENCFTDKEQSYILNSESFLEASLKKFYEIWTLKESYVKCIGKGLLIPLNTFSIIMDEDIKVRSIRNKDYKFFRFDFDSNYKIGHYCLNID